MTNECPVEEAPLSSLTNECPVEEAPPSSLTNECPVEEVPPSSHSESTGSDTIADVFKRYLAAARANLKWCSSNDTMKPRKHSSGHRAGFDAFMTGYSFACYAMGSSGGQSTERGHSSTSMTEDKVCLEQTSNEMTSDESTLAPDNVDSSISPGLLVGTPLFEGLVDMKNCLSNRGRAMPMKVVHSRYTKTSEGHRAAWKKIRTSIEE